MPLLDIKNLSVEFPTASGLLKAVDEVSLAVDEGEVLGVVGESGSGKSVTMLALMGLVAFPGRVRAERLLIADEPTTALDVTIQAQILDLLLALQRERGMALVLITHNMGVVADTAQRVMVMYAGQIMEERAAEALFAAPQHPYTAALLA